MDLLFLLKMGFKNTNFTKNYCEDYTKYYMWPRTKEPWLSVVPSYPCSFFHFLVLSIFMNLCLWWCFLFMPWWGVFGAWFLFFFLHFWPPLYCGAWVRLSLPEPRDIRLLFRLRAGPPHPTPAANTARRVLLWNKSIFSASLHPSC